MAARSSVHRTCQDWLHFLRHGHRSPTIVFSTLPKDRLAKTVTFLQLQPTKSGREGGGFETSTSGENGARGITNTTAILESLTSEQGGRGRRVACLARKQALRRWERNKRQCTDRQEKRRQRHTQTQTGTMSMLSTHSHPRTSGHTHQGSLSLFPEARLPLA